MRPRRNTGWIRRRGTAAVLAAAAGVAGGACGNASAGEPGPEERARAVEVGSAAADALAGVLGPRLSAALARGGPAHAVVFCSGRAWSLTDSVAAGLGAGVTVGRTSLRVRNPDNAPDLLDRQVLEELDEAVASGRSLPSEVVRAVPSGELRYYRPLVVTDVCMGCHGPLGELDADVREVLRVRYPADEAVGYRVGDVRGAIRVRIPRTGSGPR